MTFRRIVLGFGAAGSERVVRAATDLARSMELALLGLFVEEVDLLHLAAMPFAAEVSFPSALTRRLDPAAMERLLRAHSVRAREVLGQHLKGVPVRWDFAVVRGSALAAVLETAAEDDLVVTALDAGSLVDDRRRREAALRKLGNLRRALLLVDKVGPRAPVVAVLAPDASLQAVAPELRALSLHYGGGLSVLAMQTEAPSGAEQSDRDEHGASMVAELGNAVRVERKVGADVPSLLERIAAERPGLVVMCGSSLFFDAVGSRLAQLACSLLLLPGSLRQTGGSA